LYSLCQRASTSTGGSRAHMTDLYLWYGLWHCVLLSHMTDLYLWYGLWHCVLLSHMTDLYLWYGLWHCVLRVT